MRSVFLFPPKASPTYVPLGLASLVPYVQRKTRNSLLAVRDLNLETWTWMAQKDPSGESLLGFVQGREGDFYDEAAYAGHRDVWRRLNTELGAMVLEAGRYTDTGEADPEFLALLDRLAAMTLETDPELLGFSVMFLDQVPFTLALSRRIRSWARPGREESGGRPDRNGPCIVLGGAAMSALRADELLRICPWVDAALVGEGEAGAAALCNGEPFSRVPGLWYRCPSGIRRNEKPPTLSLRCLPPPDFSRFELGRYFNPTPVLPVLFSRGCRWRKCRFCSHNASFGGYRPKSVRGFADEIERYRNLHGAGHLYLADQYVDAEDLDKLAGEIADRALEVRFQVMGRPVKGYTRERMNNLFRAGCRWISWGVETGSQRLLDLTRKGTDVRVIERVVRDTADAGISNLLMMIFGLPTSSDPDLRHTLRFLEDLHDSVDALAISSFALWAGTPFARGTNRYGLRATGARELLRIQGMPLHSHRLNFLEASGDGSLRPPRGPMEVAEWEKRKRWMGEPTFLEQLPCEHYLLHVTRRAGVFARPLSPQERAA